MCCYGNKESLLDDLKLLTWSKINVCMKVWVIVPSCEFYQWKLLFRSFSAIYQWRYRSIWILKSKNIDLYNYVHTEHGNIERISPSKKKHDRWWEQWYFMNSGLITVIHVYNMEITLKYVWFMCNSSETFIISTIFNHLIWMN